MRKKYSIFANAIIAKPTNNTINNNVGEVDMKNNLIKIKNKLFKNFLK